MSLKLNSIVFNNLHSCSHQSRESKVFIATETLSFNSHENGFSMEKEKRSGLYWWHFNQYLHVQKLNGELKLSDNSVRLANYPLANIAECGFSEKWK